MHLVPIDRDHLAEAWPVIAPFAAQMADQFPDDYPVSEIARAAGAGELLLWVVWDELAKEAFGVVGTTVIDKPSGRRFLDVSLAAGHNHERWVHCIAQLEDHGREMGCQVASVLGRTGWARALTDYTVGRMAILTKEL